MRTLIAVISWEVGETGVIPGITLCRDLQQAREELTHEAFDDEHTEDAGCHKGPRQLVLDTVPRLADEIELDCDVCRIESWDPAEEEFFLYPEAGRGDMQVAACIVAVPE